MKKKKKRRKKEVVTHAIEGGKRFCPKLKILLTQKHHKWLTFYVQNYCKLKSVKVQSCTPLDVITEVEPQVSCVRLRGSLI